MSESPAILAFRDHLRALAGRIGPFGRPVEVRIAGDLALSYYTGHRVPGDAEVNCSQRIAIPVDMQVFEVPDPTGATGCSPVALHPGAGESGFYPQDWEARAMAIGEVGPFVLFVMDPVDLAVSKLVRFSPQDREDIRQLISRRMLDRELLEERTKRALEACIGDAEAVRRNFEETVRIVSRSM